ncbi:hypothetical protein A3B57_02240 [Microgenomates group bacterium RIFCSPLOWO2_01_FULL_47_10]|nr:MAG: hypothetical protein A3B57_02240 [Microgenomates group bacterium RIFCSPLOWO2_01_FULL_47_10]
MIKSGKVRTYDQIFQELPLERQARIKELVRYHQAAMTIRQMRKSLKLSQVALANKMNIKREVIARAESGRHNVTLETLYHIAEATGHRLDIKFV